MKTDLNGMMMSWNDCVRNGFGGHGITSPEREFDKAFNLAMEELLPMHMGEVGEEFRARLNAIDDLPDDHPWKEDPEGWLKKKFISEEEFIAKGGVGPEDY